jgi:cobalt-zinc-cadmium efflux system membrane fusion protein
MIRFLMVLLLLSAFAQPLPASDDHGHHDDHGHDDDEAKVFTVAEFQTHGVTVGTAGPGDIDLGVQLPGEVRPNGDRIAHVAPRFPGIVREVRKHVGDRIRVGDVLAVIESENLASFDLKAALDGVVIDRHIAPGEAASREDPAFIIADLSNVWVDINVYQTALPQVRVGQPVAISAGHDTLEATGTVSHVSPIVDQATRTARARVVLPNVDGAWRPGLFVTATVFNPTPVALVVPRQAIQTLEGRSVVFVVEGDRFEARPIVTGRIGRTRAEVVEGLSPGDRYADQRSFLVKAELAKGEATHAH